MSEFFKQRYSLPIIVLTTVIIVITWIKLQPDLKHQENQSFAKKAEFINTSVIPHRARVLGYGIVEPTTTLEANAEVSGKIIYLHPELKQGATFLQGTRVLKIDKSSYKIALAQAEADLATQIANLEQLSIEQQNHTISLKISTQRLRLGEKELSRKKRLLNNKSVSQSTVDIEEKNVLNLRQEVQNLKSQLSLIPPKKKVISAKISAAKAQVLEQNQNLSRTEVMLPFNARIGEVHVQEQEFVSANAALFDASDIAQVEIKAQMPMMHARTLILGMSKDIPHSPTFKISNILKQLHIEAKVRWVENLETAQWPAHVVRLGEALDPNSQTLSIIVAVDNSYLKSKPGERPPLLQGMYTEVELLAPAIDRIVIPRRALHNGNVYIATPTNQLEIRKVVIDFHQGEQSIVKSGLHVGDKIIVNDLIPAFQGMKLKPIHNKEREKHLLQVAQGIKELK